jgi:hypothetical protein
MMMKKIRMDSLEKLPMIYVNESSNNVVMDDVSLPSTRRCALMFGIQTGFTFQGRWDVQLQDHLDYTSDMDLLCVLTFTVTGNHFHDSTTNAVLYGALTVLRLKTLWWSIREKS